jgi:hypothetical protein
MLVPGGSQIPLVLLLAEGFLEEAGVITGLLGTRHTWGPSPPLPLDPGPLGSGFQGHSVLQGKVTLVALRADEMPGISDGGTGC